MDKEKCDRAIELVQTNNNLEFILAELLLDIETTGAYDQEYGDFHVFCMEAGLNRGTVSKYKKIAQKLMKEQGFSSKELAEVGVSKSYEIAKSFDSREESLAWLERAKIEPVRHLKISIKESMGEEVKLHEHELQEKLVCSCGFKCDKH